AKNKTHTEKLDPKWKGPCYINDVIGNVAYKIRQLDGRLLKAPVNGSLLKK
ncbi:8640_t:CDS:1, partial [Funneliformis geosporum]